MTQNMQLTGFPVLFPVRAAPDRKEYPGGPCLCQGCLENRSVDDRCISPVCEVSGPVSAESTGKNREGGGPLDHFAAFEIKSTSHVSGSHLSGLRAFREDHPDVPLHVIAQADHPFRLDEVLVLPWKTYLQSLGDYL